MPNVLVLSFEGFSFSSRQLYEGLLPKLLSRAVVHESLTIQDGLNYVLSGWPNIILVTDQVVTADDFDSRQMFSEIADATKHGCTTIFMGVFAAGVEHETLDAGLKELFGLPWKVSGENECHTRLHTLDENMIRTNSLVPAFNAQALYIDRVPISQVVYASSNISSVLVYAAYARVGLGKLGYIGDLNYGEESERLILAMAHLDRPEDSING